MTEIQLLHVTELLSQFGEQVVKRERDETLFVIHLSDGRLIRITIDGDKFWYLNNKTHRTDGPAAEYASGTRFWYLNGQRHRTDGPAFEYANGRKEWWLNGVKQKKPRKLSS
jgi:hypothetical protein